MLWWARLGSLHLLCFQLDHIWQFELGWLHFWLWQQCGHFHGESGRSVINTDSLIFDFCTLLDLAFVDANETKIMLMQSVGSIWVQLYGGLCTLMVFIYEEHMFFPLRV